MLSSRSQWLLSDSGATENAKMPVLAGKPPYSELLLPLFLPLPVRVSQGLNG